MNELWSDDELIVVCALYLKKEIGYTDRVKLGALWTGRTEGSIKKRFGNYEYFETDGNKGLANSGDKALIIWNQFVQNPKHMNSIAEKIIVRMILDKDGKSARLAIIESLVPFA